MIERIGRYEILERVASGGQGTVYRARDTVLDRVVAVKVINQNVEDDPAYLEALQREARLSARLDHPNITRVHDFQVEDGTPYIVMEYVPDALDRHLRNGRRLTWQRATGISVQIARALQHAHDNGVVHRDIKPQNILLREDGSVAVSDYGIARALASSTRSRTSSVMGTPAYMSPEQWASGSLDGRIDQYALGIVFYEMLTGSTPFQGESMEAMYVQHRETPIPAFAGNLQVPTAIQQVIRRATEKNPDDRYASVGVMVYELEALLSNDPSRGGRPDASSIHPPPPVVSGAKSGIGGRRPNWVLMLGVGAVVIALTSMIVGVSVAGVAGGADTVEVIRDVPVTKVVTRDVEVTREVPVTVATVVEREVVKEVPVTRVVEKEVIKEVPVPVTRVVKEEVPVTRIVPVTKIITATPPPDCFLMSEENVVSGPRWTGDSYTQHTIYFRVTNRCDRSKNVGATLIFFDNAGKITYTKDHGNITYLGPGESQVESLSAIIGSGASVKTYRIEFD